jgi:hypothetical protein
MSSKEHLTSEGLTKIISIRASMNNGLSDLLKASFPNIKPVPRPKVEFKGISDFNWVTGFVEGEACFLIKAQKKISCSKFNNNIRLFNQSAFSRLRLTKKLFKSMRMWKNEGRF